MKLTYAEAIIGGLSKPSKMPGYSWSTPANKCIAGGKLQQVEGSTCFDCYAMKGRYVFGRVKNALERRFTAIDHPQFVKAFVFVLNTKLKNSRKKRPFMRWHDSGDIQSLDHLKKINEIALQTPDFSHWLPTREFGIVNQFVQEVGEFAPNLVVRMSATMVGQDFKKRPMGLPYSTVDVESENVQQCPAYKQGGQCLECRMCWEEDKDVNYPKH